jgi:hypothetical protein
VVAPWDRRRADETARLERQALARWLPTVLAAAPFHADRSADLDDGPLDGRAGLQRLAPTRERDLLADAPGGASAVLRPTEAQVRATADGTVLGAVARAIGRDGAHGKRDALVHEYRPLQLHRAGVTGELLVASSRSDLDRMHRAGARTAAVLGLGADDVVVSAVPAGPTLAHLGVVNVAAGAGLTAFHARGAADGLDVVVAATRLLSPTVLVVEFAEVLGLARRLADATPGLETLRTVVTVGPPPAEDERARIEAALRRVRREVRVRALWAPEAGRSLWAECAPGTGLHTYPDLELLEVLDPMTGAPTDGDGDLTLTSLGWHGTALVRFQTGAWVDPLVTERPCPRCHRTVPRIVGEIEPHAWEVPVGSAAGGHVDLRGVAAALTARDGVDTWRAEVQVAEDGADRLLVEVGGTPRDGGDDDLADDIARAAGLRPVVRTGLTVAAIHGAVAEVGGQLADTR